MRTVEHLFLDYYGLGGVQSVLQRHFAEDANFGWSSRFTLYNRGPGDRSEPRLRFLGLSRWSTGAQGRRRFIRTREEPAPSFALYHIPWALDYFADLDRSDRRYLLIHGSIPSLRREVEVIEHFLDGIICVNEPLRLAVQNWLPSFDPERVAVAPYPISPLPVDKNNRLAPSEADRSNRLVIGFCGRLSFDQKRIDRIPLLCEELDRMKVPFAMEFLGSGPDESWLKVKLKSRANITFHGRKTDREYWTILSNWDAIIFTSDYEGTPIALLEALSVGVLPVYPRIGSGADAYVEELSPLLLCAPGDMAEMARALSHLNSMPEQARQELKSKRQRLLEPHLGNGYLKAVTSFVERVATKPPRASAPPRKMRATDAAPFALLAAASRLRRQARR